MTETDLVDIWREIFPDMLKYTWRKFTTFKQQRFDYLLVSAELLCDIKGAQIVSSFGSDHCLISIKLKTGFTGRGKPSGYDITRFYVTRCLLMTKRNT